MHLLKFAQGILCELCGTRPHAQCLLHTSMPYFRHKLPMMCSIHQRKALTISSEENVTKPET